MRVLIAGGTGAIGRPLVAGLVGSGHEVTVLSRSASRAADARAAGAEVVTADALEADALGAAVAGARPEVVVNQLTSLSRSSDPRLLKRGFEQTGRLRTEASASLVEAAVSAGARRIVAQSIAFAYRPGPGVRSEGDPLWTDGAGQIGRVVGPVHALESTTLDDERIEGVVLRYGTFYGPGTYYAADGAFTAMAAKRRLPLVGRGGGIFGFVHVQDAAAATAAALSGPTGVFNVVDAHPAPTAQWLPHLARLVGAKPPRHLPEALFGLMAGPYSAYLLCHQPAVSSARARQELGWVPSFDDWREGFEAELGG